MSIKAVVFDAYAFSSVVLVRNVAAVHALPEAVGTV